MNTTTITIIVVIVIFLMWYFKKESFEIVDHNNLHINRYSKPTSHNSEITKSFLENMFADLIKSVHANGPPGGANTSYQQNKFDLIFKDILVNSEKRNTDRYPNPNQYSILINLNIDKIYKAELIEVYVPAATDNAVNIPTFGNRLYFTYTNGYKTTTGYLEIQAGTYLSPMAIANELTRQFNTVLTYAGFCLSKEIGVSVMYVKNLNRYVFYDRAFCSENTLVIYPTNGYFIIPGLTVEHSICKYIMLEYEGPEIFSPYVSGPRCIKSQESGLYVGVATGYGKYTDCHGHLVEICKNSDALFSNCIISDVVLTHDKLYLSLGKLNGNTCNVLSYQTPSCTKGNVQNIFCQVPNNTIVSSSAVKTMLNQPGSYSAIQFYNPLVNRLNRLDVAWYNEEGKLVRILDHCFTLRIYYLQKRIDITDFSHQII
jgi:hypothetical protein